MSAMYLVTNEASGGGAGGGGGAKKKNTTLYYRLHTSAASSLKKKKNPTTHKRPAKINLRIVARPLDELIRPLWAESKGFQYIP